jgi:NAD(P)H dehydrogenase (quinone)
MKKLIIAYYSRTGNTKKIAESISEGAKTVNGVNVVLQNVESIDPKEAVEADGFVLGSPSYFSIMSGPMLSLLTEFYLLKDKLANKPMAAFATGMGNQVNTAENIECILKSYNPELIPGIVTSTEISETDLQLAKKLGEKLAKTITKI